ncbi:MAG TPA: hypothetical protein DCQ31_03990 [Bacteroidales bacterium]|nr:hypothetical protein [Bacteroidales bacterium]
MGTVRKWFHWIHRDFGYFFFGVTVIYAISGIALNHKSDWNGNFIIERTEIQTEVNLQKDLMTKEIAKKILSDLDPKIKYKKFYYPNSEEFKIFIVDGSVVLNIASGEGYLETIKKRPIFNDMNYLHYNPITWWTWFSDIYAGALLILAITGLFLIKGRNGITGRGAWLTTIGILIPLIFLWILR